jgi:hypothetical protein
MLSIMPTFKILISAFFICFFILESCSQDFTKKSCNENVVSTEGKPTTIIFKNETNKILTFYWIDSEGKTVKFGEISPMESVEQETSIGHCWKVVDSDGKCLGKFVSLKEGTVNIPLRQATGENINQPQKNTDRISPPERSNPSAFSTYNTDSQPSEQVKPHSSAPQIISIFQNNRLHFAWKDLTTKKVKISSYSKSNNQFTPIWHKDVPAGLAILGGLTGDGDNLYCTTAIEEDLSKNQTVLGYRANVLNLTKINKDGNVVWNKNLNTKQYFINPVFSPTIAGTSDLAYGNEKIVLIHAGNTLPDASIGVRHQKASYTVVDAETGNPSAEGNNETSWRHSFDQRILFDGKDFIIMDLGDAGYMPAGGIAVRKIIMDSPAQPIPNQNHEGTYVYARNSSHNFTFISMGDVVAGEAGYGILFSSEKTNRKQSRDGWDEPVLEPRNLGFVHIVKDFDQVNDGRYGNNPQTGNTWFSESPYGPAKINITENIVDTRANNAQAQIGGQQLARPDKPNLTFNTASVAWLTNFQAGQTFTSAERPKLIKIAQGQYVAVWEEWLVSLRASQSPSLTYQSTKAMLIDEYGNILKSAVNISARLNPNGADKLFLVEGKAAWIVGESNQFKLYTLNTNLQLEEFKLDF